MVRLSVDEAVASHWGGTRNGTIVHWPNGIKEKGACAISSAT